MFKIRYKKATGEIVEWGETITIENDEYGVIEEKDDSLMQYLTIACSVDVNKGSLIVDNAKIDKLKNVKPLPLEIEAETINVKEVRNGLL